MYTFLFLNSSGEAGWLSPLPAAASPLPPRMGDSPPGGPANAIAQRRGSGGSTQGALLKARLWMVHFAPYSLHLRPRCLHQHRQPSPRLPLGPQVSHPLCLPGITSSTPWHSGQQFKAAPSSSRRPIILQRWRLCSPSLRIKHSSITSSLRFGYRTTKGIKSRLILPSRQHRQTS